MAEIYGFPLWLPLTLIDRKTYGKWHKSILTVLHQHRLSQLSRIYLVHKFLPSSSGTNFVFKLWTCTNEKKKLFGVVLCMTTKANVARIFWNIFFFKFTLYHIVFICSEQATSTGAKETRPSREHRSEVAQKRGPLRRRRWARSEGIVFPYGKAWIGRKSVHDSY